ncbi:hypothetical protein [Haladaptatus halobius]|nr:hypothetical protein [Haladaptatus halobius]
MSGNLPNPENVSADELVNLIQNLPEEKREKVLSQISGDVGSNLGM